MRITGVSFTGGHRSDQKSGSAIPRCGPSPFPPAEARRHCRTQAGRRTGRQAARSSGRCDCVRPPAFATARPASPLTRKPSRATDRPGGSRAVATPRPNGRVEKWRGEIRRPDVDVSIPGSQRIEGMPGVQSLAGGEIACRVFGPEERHGNGQPDTDDRECRELRKRGASGPQANQACGWREIGRARRNDHSGRHRDGGPPPYSDPLRPTLCSTRDTPFGWKTGRRSLAGAPSCSLNAPARIRSSCRPSTGSC